MKKKLLKTFIFVTAFILMSLVTIGAGYYKKATAVEQSSNFKIELDEHSNNKNIAKTTVINIGEQGLPKKLVQPNLQSTQGIIINKGQEDLPLKLIYKGFDGNITISSKVDKSYGLNGNLNTVLKTKQGLDIKVLLAIPRSKTNKHVASAGIINIINLKNNNVIGIIPVKVINSDIKGTDNDDSLKSLLEEEFKQ